MSKEIEFNMNNSENIDMDLSRKELANLVFPEAKYTVDDLESRYPVRELKQGAIVARVAPSPTGFMHIGGIYSALVSERLAHQSGGIFFLRVEDTDKKREVEGARTLIIDSLHNYGIEYDEGPVSEAQDSGEYGPYTQSQRVEIYQSMAKHLLEKGLAYVCFATAGELEEISDKQKELKTRPGYYGEWAMWRDRPVKEVIELVKKGTPYVIRFRSPGNVDKKVKVNDLFKGDLVLPENDQDIVILKSNGIPTYHFAHTVDDHFMRTTHVLRGDEWLSSLPLHLQLFTALGWEIPVYGHFAPIMKMEGESKRKLSKRKDPEANIEFYDKSGFPKEAVLEYLLNLANSSFEDWRAKNPKIGYQEYKLSLHGLTGGAGALLDLTKLRDISKDVIARKSAEEVYTLALDWSNKYDQEMAELLNENREYAISIFGIERDGDKTRKDIVTLADLRKEIGYFFDELFSIQAEEMKMVTTSMTVEDISLALQKMKDSYKADMTKDEWLENLRDISEALGYARNPKDFKKEPEKFKGHMGDIARLYRVLLVGRNQSPDLFEVMKTLGSDRINKRLDPDLLNNMDSV